MTAVVVLAVLVACVAVAGRVVVAERRVRGLSPEQLSLQAAALHEALRSGDVASSSTPVFRCSDGTEVPLSRVNDDYCDCPGVVAVQRAESTKAGEAAPPVGTFVTDEPGTNACSAGAFFCAQHGFESTFVPPGAVNDGICDCCDGADEWASGACENTCRSAGADQRAALVKELQDHKDGLKRAQELVAAAAEAKAALARERDARSETIAALEKRQPGLEAARDEAKKAEEDERARLVAEGSLRPESSGEEASKDDTIPEDDAVFEDDDEEAEMGAADDDDDDDEDDDDEDDEDEEAAPPAVPDEIQAVSEAYMEKFKTATQQAQDALTSLENELSEAQRKANEANDVLARSYGPDDIYFTLRDQCYEQQTPEYTYEVCLYGAVTQKGGTQTNLGRWDWESSNDNDETWVFGGGTKCWGGPDRSATFSLVCGADFALTDADEPNRCEYSFSLATPGACRQDRHDQLVKLLADPEADAAASADANVDWI